MGMKTETNNLYPSDDYERGLQIEVDSIQLLAIVSYQEKRDRRRTPFHMA